MLKNAARWFMLVTLILISTALSAKADVIWTLYETSFAPKNGSSSMVPQFPFVVGQLDIPSINSSGSYSYMNGVQTGVTDFSFEFS